MFYCSNQKVNQIVTISNVSVIRVWNRLIAHRLYSDFQYFVLKWFMPNVNFINNWFTIEPVFNPKTLNCIACPFLYILCWKLSNLLHVLVRVIPGCSMSGRHNGLDPVLLPPSNSPVPPTQASGTISILYFFNFSNVFLFPDNNSPPPPAQT